MDGQKHIGCLDDLQTIITRTSSQQSSVNIVKLGILLPLLPFEPALTSFLCMVICIYLALLSFTHIIVICTLWGTRTGKPQQSSVCFGK